MFLLPNFSFALKHSHRWSRFFAISFALAYVLINECDRYPRKFITGRGLSSFTKKMRNQVNRSVDYQDRNREDLSPYVYSPTTARDKTLFTYETLIDASFFPKLHDKNASSFKEKYVSRIKTFVTQYHGSGEPLMHSFVPSPNGTGQGPFFAVWTKGGQRVNASAWRVDGKKIEYLDGHTYVRPPEYASGPLTSERNIVDVSGDHAAFHGWFPDFYGHVVDFHMSQIAFLKYAMTDYTRFLLLDVGESSTP